MCAFSSFCYGIILRAKLMRNASVLPRFLMSYHTNCPSWFSVKAAHLVRFSQTAAASPPSILLQTHRGAMISLFPSGRTRPDRHFLHPRPVSLSPGHRSVLTNTDSLRHSRASGAPLLFWPTRKSPRQATPPPRHREQQHGDWRRTRKQMATPVGNDRFGNEEGRKTPRRSGS